MNHKNVLFASAAALACAAAGAVAQPWEYAVIEIDDLGYGSSGRAINDLGWITGTADNGFDLRAYLWAEPGPMLDLGSLPGGSGRSRGWGINNLGWVAGESSNSEDRTVPVLWRDGKITEIDGPGSFVGMGYDVNDAGIVVGPASWELSGGNRKWIGFRWHNGTLHQLVGLMGPDTGSYASAINEFGDIAGSSEAPDGSTNAVIWRDGTIEDLGDLGRLLATATDINDLDQVVGWGGSSSAYGNDHAFLWEEGRMRDLHRFGEESVGEAINNFGVVVGWVTFSSTPYDWTGFRWTEEDSTVDLNKRTSPLCHYEIVTAQDINDAGQITGYGRVGGGSDADNALLINPVHISMTLDVNGSNLISGRANELIITRVTPGKRVYFAWSEAGGGSYIPGCTLQENALQLQNPKSLGYVTADANGVAVLSRYVPRPAQGKTILIQAVVPGECAVSNLILETIQ